ncbi:hypothetical protein [Aeromicrobium sp. CTD01-1L150]|uniref:hypothetical protein n=1 Tax=Aeromicrobium sp. CTD01-1L150 TaxID=3341830 RepID=UPI0035BF91F5
MLNDEPADLNRDVAQRERQSGPRTALNLLPGKASRSALSPAASLTYQDEWSHSSDRTNELS